MMLQVSKSWLELVDLEITNLGPGAHDTGIPEETLAARFPKLTTLDFG